MVHRVKAVTYDASISYLNAVSLSIQLPSNLARKAAEDGPGSWDSATHVGNMDGQFGSWLWSGPDRNVVSIVRVT